MSRQLSTVHSFQFAHLQLCEGVSHLPCMGDPAEFFHVFRNRSRCTDVLQHVSLLPAEKKSSQHADDQIRGNKCSLFIHTHHPVGITVEDDAEVTVVLLDGFNDIPQVFLLERIWCVIGKGAVERLEEVMRFISQKVSNEKSRHSVGTVHAQVDLREVGGNILFHKIHI